MPINKPELQKHTRMFTQQDFLDGKCTKDGFPLDKGAQSNVPPPEPEPTPQVEPSPVADEAKPTEAVQPEASPAEGQELPEQPKEGE